MITISDIARAVGVSTATVSRALNDSPAISEETKRRVRRAERELGYVTNSAASVMRSRRSTLLGLVMPDLENDYAVIARALAECCTAEGFQLVLSLTNEDPQVEYEHLYALASARAAGVLVVVTGTPVKESLRLLQQFPCVQLIRRSVGLDSDWVTFDEKAGISAAVAHLVELGHSRIAYVGGSSTLSTGSARLRSFRAAMRTARLPVLPDLMSTGPVEPDRSQAAFAEIYTRYRPTAVVTGGQRHTVGIVQAVEQLGIAVPDDLSIVSYGDTHWFRWWGPGLTSVAFPVRDIAIASAELMVRKVRNRGKAQTDMPDQPYNAIHMPHLVVRGSTAATR